MKCAYHEQRDREGLQSRTVEEVAVSQVEKLVDTGLHW
jgi:hypothetical protein